MKELQQIISNYVLDRPVMFENNSDNHKLLSLLIAEVGELAAVLDDKEEMGRELSDVLFFCFTLANMNDIDLEEELRTKTARNMCKRPAVDWQSGDYKTQDRISRQKWAENGGDGEFYK